MWAALQTFVKCLQFVSRRIGIICGNNKSIHPSIFYRLVPAQGHGGGDTERRQATTLPQNTHNHRENSSESNPGPSYCEATLLTTSSLCIYHFSNSLLL